MLRQEKILSEVERSRTDFLSQKNFFLWKKESGTKAKKPKTSKKERKKVFPL